MVLTSSDKPAWLGALNSIALKDKIPEETQKYLGTPIYSFTNDRLNVNCVAQINERVKKNFFELWLLNLLSLDIISGLAQKLLLFQIH